MVRDLMLRKNISWLLVVGLTTMIHWSTVPSASSGETGHQMTSNELVQRGKELRNEIDSVYKTLKVEKKITGGRGTDISDGVRKYIPPGTSFDDAEEILRAAGFDVSSRPLSDTMSNAPDRYSVGADLKLGGSFGIKIQAIVVLTPKGPGDYSEVSRVSAGIFLSSL
jgi:hypothetical protein